MPPLQELWMRARGPHRSWSALPLSYKRKSHPHVLPWEATFPSQGWRPRNSLADWGVDIESGCGRHAVQDRLHMPSPDIASPEIRAKWLELLPPNHAVRMQSRTCKFAIRFFAKSSALKY